MPKEEVIYKNHLESQTIKWCRQIFMDNLETSTETDDQWLSNGNKKQLSHFIRWLHFRDHHFISPRKDILRISITLSEGQWKWKEAGINILHLSFPSIRFLASQGIAVFGKAAGIYLLPFRYRLVTLNQLQSKFFASTPPRPQIIVKRPEGEGRRKR